MVRADGVASDIVGLLEWLLGRFYQQVTPTKSGQAGESWLMTGASRNGEFHSWWDISDEAKSRQRSRRGASPAPSVFVNVDSKGIAREMLVRADSAMLKVAVF
jgi:hypothetical protein